MIDNQPICRCSTCQAKFGRLPPLQLLVVGLAGKLQDYHQIDHRQRCQRHHRHHRNHHHCHHWVINVVIVVFIVIVIGIIIIVVIVMVMMQSRKQWEKTVAGGEAQSWLDRLGAGGPRLTSRGWWLLAPQTPMLLDLEEVLTEMTIPIPIHPLAFEHLSLFIQKHLGVVTTNSKLEQ